MYSELDFPRDIISVETLEYLGLESRPAGIIWNGWNRLSSGERHHYWAFVEYALRHLKIEPEPADSEWAEYLSRIGINPQLRRAILLPAYDDVRLTMSVGDWLRWIFEARFSVLKQEHREEFLIRPTPTSYRFGYDGHHDSHSGDSHRPSPGHIILWKAKSRLAAEKMWPKPHRGGDVDIEHLNSPPPTDFSSRHARLYLASDVRGAIHYAQYCKATAGVAVCLVRYEVPEAVVRKSQPMELYWPNDKFKRTIIAARTNNLNKGVLVDVQSAELIIGHTARGTWHRYEKRGPADLRKEDLIQLKTAGEKEEELMVQFAFKQGFFKQYNPKEVARWLSIWDETGKYCYDQGVDTREHALQHEHDHRSGSTGHVACLAYHSHV